MPDLSIRSATEADAEPIARIYNHYILGSTATFDTEVKSAEDRRAWIAEHSGAYPALVGVNPSGEVVAWGALSRWGTRCAYRHTVEISVYVRHDATRGGVGPELARALVGEARALGHHAVVSQIVHENAPSLKMAESLGFEHIGTLKEVGRKFDRWLDVVLMELVIDAAPDSPGTLA